MERRIFFIAGDALSNSVTGMAAALLAINVVDPAWHMIPAMLAGMAAGMGLSMVLMPVFVGLFGAMEVMLPVMLTAMLAGMVFGMAGVMHEFTTFEVVAGGCLIGMLTLLLTYVTDAGIRSRDQ